MEKIKTKYLPKEEDKKSLSRTLKSAKPLSKLSEKKLKIERVSTPKGKSRLQIKDKPNPHKSDVLNKTAKHSEKKQIRFTKENKEDKDKKEKERKEREEKKKKEKEEKQKIKEEKKKEREEKKKEEKKKRDEEAKKRKEEKEKKDKELKEKREKEKKEKEEK